MQLNDIVRVQKAKGNNLPKREPLARVAVPRSVELPSGVEGDNWALFLSTLALHTSLTRERRDHGHWVNLHNQNLSTLLGRSYRRRIDAMIDAGIVERNDRYSTGMEGVKAFTKSYRIAEQHRTGQSRQHCITSRPVAKKVAKTYAVDPENLGQAGMHYRECFNKLRLDEAAAEDPKLTNHWDQWTIARWHNRQEFAKRCDYGRYHGLTSQLPKRARKHLRTINGEDIVVVDVSACQPLITGHLAHQHTTGNHPPQRAPLPYDARFSKMEKNKTKPDVARWIELCESKSFYRYFFDSIQTFDGDTTATIKLQSGRTIRTDMREMPERSIKRATLIPVFDRTDAMRRSPIFRIIERDFPTIANFIVAAKESGHQRLACLLQRTESGLMIDGLGNELRKRHPGVTAQPIHDAIVVPVSFAATAAELIREQFGRVGLSPSVTADAV
ncbi:hypothetical protein FHS27_003311 [Rhodopirellula rubra]|uniref:Uncharacterized protein n=1 Tax=Aporhodopirellula rubra TaxID=980271 RepID=A0A7W5H719_9BACT|nr:hypothetical protein [Aporhodopirellula rubra]MBB3207486.1 hypothetical protein [Aporhodopirellula rubra]